MQPFQLIQIFNRTLTTDLYEMKSPSKINNVNVRSKLSLPSNNINFLQKQLLFSTSTKLI